MSLALEAASSRAAKLEACRALVDNATRRANDAMESAVRRRSVPAELAAYRLEADALELEAALCRLEDAPPALWERCGYLTPEELLHQARWEGGAPATARTG